MRIDDDLDVNPAIPANISTDLSVDTTALKVNATLREMFDQTLSRENASVKLNESVIKYLQLMGKMATDKRGEIEKEKRTYEKTYKLSSQLIKDIAKDRLMGAAIAAPFALGGLSPNRLDQLAGEQLSKNIVPGLNQMWTSGKEAEKARADAVSGLAMQELNNQTSQSQSEANNKSELARIIADQGAAVKEAARGG